MEFQCVCGKALSTDAAPGSVVRCPACGQTIRVPGAAHEDTPTGVPPVPPPYPVSAAIPTSGLAVTALVLGLVSLIFGPFTGIPAIILGIVALNKAKKSEGRTGDSAMAIAGLVTGPVLTLVAILVILPVLARTGGAAPSVTCASNLRQVGIALTNYAVENDDKMPPADLNTFHYLANYMGESTLDAGGSDVFRCTSHEWLPQKKRGRYGSYAFNVSLNEDENDTYSPFSVARTGRWKRLGATPPETILAIEMWMRTRPDGTFPNELRLNDPDWSLIKAGVAPISSYTATDAAKFDTDGRLIDPGPYRFLDCYKGTDVPVSDMYHIGYINVLFADGTVAQEDIRTFTSRPPSKEPRWTRMRD